MYLALLRHGRYIFSDRRRVLSLCILRLPHAACFSRRASGWPTEKGSTGGLRLAAGQRQRADQSGRRPRNPSRVEGSRDRAWRGGERIKVPCAWEARTGQKGKRKTMCAGVELNRGHWGRRRGGLVTGM
jgi:hypothetical protein